MIKMEGKYNKAIIYADRLMTSDIGQIQSLLDSPLSEGSTIRFMPDVHAGKGCVIGTTMTAKTRLCPNIVGVDIGCGMLTLKLANKRINLPELDSCIQKYIPAGLDKIRDVSHTYANQVNLYNLIAKVKNEDKLYRSIGSLGGGNHFIEIDKDDEGCLYLIIHTGSRNLGVQVAEYWQKVAYKECKIKGEDVPYELAWLEGESMRGYVHDMLIAQSFAYWNRMVIAKEILGKMHLKFTEDFETVHNYIDGSIIRKGAISAKSGERVLIPLNMKDGSILGIGRGNPEWNESAPHGAGRFLSRKDAKNSISMTDYKRAMEGIFSTSVCKETVDEAPQAYKPSEEIISAIGDTVQIEKVIKPIYNFKAV